MDSDRLGPPVDVRALLGPERQALLELLAGLAAPQWAAPTPCPRWSVHDLTVHLLHDDLRRLSAQRDRHRGQRSTASSVDELAAALDEANDGWVAAVAPTLSPRLTCELLAWSGAATQAHLCGLAPGAVGETVSWAGPGPHPNWLDVAREYTERWVHHQQLRQAVGRPGLTRWEFLGPVVDTFARALPACLPARPPGTEVRLCLSAPHRCSWTLRAHPHGWGLAEPAVRPAAVVELPADVFWRRAVRMLGREQSRRVARAEGDAALVAAMLDVRAAIVPDTDPRTDRL